MVMHKKLLADSASRRSFIGGSGARVIWARMKKALICLWWEKWGAVALKARATSSLSEALGESRPAAQMGFADHTFFRFRNRTPAPPPFSSMNSMPAASRAFCTLARTSSDTGGPNPASKRLIVMSESLALSARSV
jgi:hypothetical protein